MVLSRLTKITGPGVATDTNWVGNNADFTGITTTATSFNIGVTTIHSNLIEAHNIKSTGIVTATGGSFSGNITAVDGTFSGNVSIAGTLTYEDVTNIDSVGIITAPALDVDDFLDVGSNIKLGNAGVITATSFVGSGAALTGIDATAIKDSGGNVKIQAQASGAIHSGVSTFQDIDVDGHTNLDNVSVAGFTTFTSNIEVADSIIHNGDTNTMIRFPADDQIQFEAGGNEKLKLDSSGNVYFAGNRSGNDRGIIYNDSNGFGIYGSSSGTNHRNILFLSSSSGSSERLRITSTGLVGIGTDSPQHLLDVTGNAAIGPIQIAGNPGPNTGIATVRGHFVNAVGDFARLYFSNSQSSGGTVGANAYISGKRDGISGSNWSAGLAFHTNYLNPHSNSPIERMVITSTGLVGIGTDIPGRPLTITHTDPRIRLQDDDTGSFSEVYTDNSGHLYLSADAGQANGGSRILFNIDGSEKVRITSTGMVGIGTNNIDSPLEVVGTGPSLVTIHHGDGGTNDEARIMLGALPNNPPDNRGAGIAAVNNGAGHDLTIKCSTNHSSGPSEKVRITSAGQMVMGATTSKAKFEIKDNGYTSTSALQRISADDDTPYALIIANDTLNTGTVSGLQFFVGNTGTHMIRARGSSTASNNNLQLVAQNDVIFNSGSSESERLRIDSNGQINATGSSTGNPIGITIKNSNTAAYSHARLRLESQNASKYADVFCDIPNNSLRLAYNSSNSLYISQEGNVGLGTATPQNSSGYATLTCSGSTGGQMAFFGGSSRHFIWGNSSGNLNIGGGYVGGGDVRIYTNGNNERLRIDSGGHAELRNSANSHQELRWYVNNSKSASIGWGNGSANWEFKHFRNDNQADNPYANIDFFTGSTTSPTRALRITNDGNHIREKHSRFATRIEYDSGNEAVNEVLNFRSPHINVGNDFDSSNNYYVAPVDGDYAFWFHTNVAKPGSGAYYVIWQINGSEVTAYGGRIYDQHSGGGWHNLSGCVMFPLQEGDQVRIVNKIEVNFDGGAYGQFMGWLVG